MKLSTLITKDSERIKLNSESPLHSLFNLIKEQNSHVVIDAITTSELVTIKFSNIEPPEGFVLLNYDTHKPLIAQIGDINIYTVAAFEPKEQIEAGLLLGREAILVS